MKPQNLAPFYEGWRFTNERLVEKIGALSLEQLELRAAPELWPVWAIAAHIAGARVYWLCGVLKVPGAEGTPFTNPNGDGWEDDLTRPRDSDELVVALESSWKVVEGCLERWTVPMLQDEFRREREGTIQVHTRQAVLFRLLTHDAEHCGQMSETLGIHGLDGIDLWTGRAPTD